MNIVIKIRVCKDISGFVHESKIDKKMYKFDLFMSKGTPGAIYDEADIEMIEDYRALDNKILTDGCCLILETELKKSFEKDVASMLVRIGGAKTQMMSATAKLLADLVREDQKLNPKFKKKIFFLVFFFGF